MSQYRRAITQARFNEGPSKFVAFEFVVTAIIVGALTESLLFGVGTFMALSIGIIIPYISLLIILAYTGLWALISVQLGYEAAGIAGAIVIGSFGAFVGFGIHLSGLTGLAESI